MSPLVLELIMYPKYNLCLWEISDVVKAIKRRKNESAAAKFCVSIQKTRLDKKKDELYLWDSVMHALNDIGNVTTGDMDEGCNDECMEVVA
jgi:hypothetical protein